MKLRFELPEIAPTSGTQRGAAPIGLLQELPSEGSCKTKDNGEWDQRERQRKSEDCHHQKTHTG